MFSESTKISVQTCPCSPWAWWQQSSTTCTAHMQSCCPLMSGLNCVHWDSCIFHLSTLLDEADIPSPIWGIRLLFWLCDPIQLYFWFSISNYTRFLRLYKIFNISALNPKYANWKKLRIFLLLQGGNPEPSGGEQDNTLWQRATGTDTSGRIITVQLRGLQFTERHI